MNFSNGLFRNNFSDNLLTRLHEKKFKHALSFRLDPAKVGLSKMNNDTDSRYSATSNLIESFENKLNDISNSRNETNKVNNEIAVLTNEINDRQLDINYYNMFNFILIVILILFTIIIIFKKYT